MASKEKKDKVKKQTVKQEPTRQSNGNQKRTIDDGMSLYFLTLARVLPTCRNLSKKEVNNKESWKSFEMQCEM